MKQEEKSHLHIQIVEAKGKMLLHSGDISICDSSSTIATEKTFKLMVCNEVL